MLSVKYSFQIGGGLFTSPRASQIVAVVWALSVEVKLTYKSIRELVDELVVRERLVHRPSRIPELGIEIAARDMFVTPEIDALAKRPFADTDLGERQAALALYLDAFAELNQITVWETPNKWKPRDTMLARVDPPEDEFWSMRIVHPETTAGMRVLGGFCGQDAFVGLIYDYRENIPAGHFDDEVDRLRAAWADYFGKTGPHSGESIDDYLTNHYKLD